MDSQLQRRAKIEGPPQQQTRLGGLRGIQSVEWAVAAAGAIIGSVGAKTWVA